MKYQKLTVVSDLVLTGELSKSREDWGKAEGAEIPVLELEVLGNRIREKALRHSNYRGSFPENKELKVQELWFNVKWHPGEEGREGFSKRAMKPQALQDLLPRRPAEWWLRGSKEPRLGGDNLKFWNTGRNHFRTACAYFARYFSCFSSEKANALSNTCAHLHNKRKIKTPLRKWTASTWVPPRGT